MPKVTPESLDAALKRGTPDRVYLLFGDNEFLKEEKVREAIALLVEAGTRDFNLDMLRGSEVDAGRLSAVLDALPVMATRRLVVIREVTALKKEPKAILDRYLSNPAPDTVLILVAPPSSKPDTTILSRSSSVNFSALSESEALTWTIARATEMGCSIEPDAARLLIDAMGPDPAAINGELGKLRDFSPDGPIAADAVRAIVGVSEGRTASDLIDIVCARDGRAASALVPVVLSQPKVSAVGLVMSLTTHLLGIGQVLIDRGNRVSHRQQITNLYAMMGEARSAAVGRPWGEAVGAMTKHADQWDGHAVDRALSLLAGADSALKETGLSRDDQILGTLTLTMCARRERSTRAA